MKIKLKCNLYPPGQKQRLLSTLMSLEIPFNVPPNWAIKKVLSLKLFLVKTWNRNQHIKAISLIFLLAFASGWALEKFTNAALPFIDSFTTWGAIVTTYMVAKRLLENWIYWFVIDTISVFLFYSRGLFLTSILFFVYLIIIYFGYKSWTEMKDEIDAKN